ncbi:hypothetical protein BT96DRAFT_870234 [Gymnopus androsaceus JB14]|uniref:Proteophosphoglycan ppg4 n=1 Tax=Gymnopus androsaceus JB14 TaxID=1447944 RepID=A0A6A4IGM2_9AGAR|nr:hypothetical protein BT96DRAFT_870234 [Gymnopus androsaceus JB14]
MTTALYSAQNGPGPSMNGALHTPLMNELDFRDNRYPTLTVKSAQDQRSGWEPEEKEGRTSPALQKVPSRNGASDVQSSSISYSLPQNNRRVVERYSLDNDAQQDSPLPATLLPSAPRHPSLPAAGIGAGPSNANGPLIIPLSASPTYTPPISSRQRAYPQQPTYIQNVSPNPVNPVYLPNTPPEEVCIECAMRDQDMADVDVTSPGVWERESDVHFEELKRQEAEEEATGIVNTDGPPRPKTKGGKLTEPNLKLWLSVNPREPTSRQQTLNSYIKSQRTLLEAEALARARALHEAKELDSRMRDTYSQLRRSAYDMGNSATPADDNGGVRIKPPISPASPAFPRAHDRSHSRDVTLLENGMIVEHVDVRKEEKEARDRRRKDERRARKSSRSSAVDVNSLMSTHSLAAPHTDSGVGLKPYSRYSQASSARPMSVLTAPLDRPDLPRALSQASFSDVHSLGSPSPRRTRFFGVRSSYWKSQDSLAMSGVSGVSGSMMDMHVALQREGTRAQMVQSPVEIGSSRKSQIWPTAELAPVTSRQSVEKPKKKKGLAKIWHLVTRSGKNDASSTRESQSLDRTEDDADYPLAPPPPISYLVSRGSPGDRMGARHASTPSLPSTASPRLALPSTTGVSPPTAPSTTLPSPASSRQSGADQDTPETRKPSPSGEETETQNSGLVGTKNVYSVISEPDLRQRVYQTAVPIADVPIANHLSQTVSSRLTISTMSREKSLPPLPSDAATLRPYVNGNARDSSRPRTVYTFDSRPPGTGAPHDFLPPQAAFRTEVRRQSFGGLTSRPNLSGLLSRSTNGRTATNPRRSLAPNYGEFGDSRGSLRLPTDPTARNSLAGPTGPTKRRSMFGLSSFLGKKRQSRSPEKELYEPQHQQQPYQQPYQHQQQVQQFPAMRVSGSDVHDEVMTGYATSNSRHSVFSGSGVGGPRMSVTSRKALDELVSQDAEFVAYRYPSNDQRLDLLR